jgi:regulation of enolase protein 1 (concanavalin A-like superfamily)
MFEPSAPPVVRGAAAAVHAARAGPRTPGFRPELLDRLPTNPLLSPPIFAVGGVFALLYGLVLFGVVNSWKNRPVPEPVFQPRETIVAFAPLPPVDTNPPKEKTQAKSDEAKAKEKAKPKADSKDKAKKPDSKNKKKSTPKKKAGEKGKTGNPNAPKDDSGKQPIEIARADTSKPGSKPEEPTKPAEPPPPPRLETWGPLVGAPWDCRFLADGTGMTMTIPGVLHVLSPDLGLKNAPRLMAEVKGDFVAMVKVPGRILPGTKPFGKLPFTFQGAGLLLWQDENNYLRLEKATLYAKEGGRKTLVHLELCKEGKVASLVPLPVREGDLTLKFDRRGSEVRCSYSPDDGKTWLEVKRQMVPFPNVVAVGVSASNASPITFQARFEDLHLKGPGVKPWQGPAPGSQPDRLGASLPKPAGSTPDRP